MGGWVLEICKMAMYVSFPVGLFHYFNSPGTIEGDLAQARIDYIEKFIGNQSFIERSNRAREVREQKLVERKNE